MSAEDMSLHEDEHAEYDEHPNEAKYIQIAVILAIVTAAEVLVYYIESLRRLLVPVLLGMAVVKFALVALYFMHLKFDSRMFRRFFLVGLVLALAVFTIVILSMAVISSTGSTG